MTKENIKKIFSQSCKKSVFCQILRKKICILPNSKSERYILIKSVWVAGLCQGLWDTNISRPATLQESQIWMVMKKKSEWYHGSPPSPLPSPISYMCRMKNIHREERKALLHDVEVEVYPQFRKKTTHSLQVKGLYHRAGTDHLKRLKIKNQLQKWLNCHCLRWKPLLGGLGTCSPREILKMYAANEALWGYSTSFHNFFSTS